jgi:hypothetical protein
MFLFLDTEKVFQIINPSSDFHSTSPLRGNFHLTQVQRLGDLEKGGAPRHSG